MSDTTNAAAIDIDSLDFKTAGDEEWANTVPFINKTSGDPVVTAIEQARPAEAAAEEPAEQVEAAEPAESESAPVDEGQERIAKLARDAREAKRRMRQLEAENQALRGERTETLDEKTERLVEQRAAEKATQRASAEKTQVVIDQGYKEYGRAAFDEAAATVSEDTGPAFNHIRDALLDIPDAHKIVKYLADNPDISSDLARMAPARLGVALARVAEEIRPKPKAISKAPPPPSAIKIIKSAKSTKSELDMDMDELAALTRQQMIGRRMH